MRHYLKQLLIIGVTLAVTFTPIEGAHTVNTVRAQTPTWSHDFDFTVAEDGWRLLAASDVSPAAIPRGSWVPSSGYQSDLGLECDPTPCPYQATSFAIIYKFVSSTTFTHFDADYVYTAGTSDGPAGARTFYSSLAATTSPATGNFAWDGSTAISELIIQCRAGYAALPPDDPGGSCLLTTLHVEGEGDDPFTGFIRPVRVADVIADVPDGNNTLLATVPQAPVFALANGLVTQVIHTPTGFVVQLTIGADTVIYSNLLSTFVQPSDILSAGCVVGYAGDSADNLPNTSTLYIISDPDLPDWHDFPESLSAIPCGQSSACLNANPDFDNNGAGWSSRIAIADSLNNGEDSMMLLPPDGMLYQPGFDVATGDSYFITIVAAPTFPATQTELEVLIGGTAQTLAIRTINSEFVTVETSAIGPVFSGVSEFRLTNNYPGNNTIRITFACLHKGDAKVAPGTCYFSDPSLHSDSFDTAGGATYHPPSTGAGGGTYEIPDGGSIRAPIDISAFADADTIFNLKIGGAAGAAGTPTLTVNIVDTGTEDELLAIGDWVFPTIFYSEATLPFTLSATEHLVGDLLIKNNTGGGEIAFVNIVCLSSATGIWPGYENPDHISGSVLPADCTPCHTPETITDVVAWLSWIGCVLRYLIYCLLYTLVNNVWNTILAIGSGLGLLGRWFAAAISKIASWALIWAGNLFGRLFSIAIPLINLILAWLVTLPFVQSVLDTASLAGVFFEGVWAFLLAIVSLFVAAVRFVGVLLGLVGTAWTQFLVALSESSTISFPFPDCADSETPFYDACIPLDVLNFLVSNVPAIGGVFAAVSVAILWKKIKQAIPIIREIFA